MSDNNLNGINTCFCIGPQNGKPLCPCAMRNVYQKDGRWIQRETDLGAVKSDWEIELMNKFGRVSQETIDACDGIEKQNAVNISNMKNFIIGEKL